MTQQPSTSRRSVALAAVFLVLASAAFAASFYTLDGARIAKPVLDSVLALFDYSTPEPAAPASPPQTKLVLPPGMPEAFALRIWQEQVDSRSMIERLVNGQVRSLRIDKVEKAANTARLRVTVVMVDGSSAPGTIGFKRFGDDWYVAYATGGRTEETGGQVDAMSGGTSATGPLPALEDVDVQLLSTILAEQTKSQSVIDEYLAGIVKEVLIKDVQPGPRTATLNVEMDETHGDGYARLVAIRSDGKDATSWFLARFIKTGDETETAQ